MEKCAQWGTFPRSRIGRNIQWKGYMRMAKKNTYDADSISILEGLEAVRKRPGMYIGSVSTKGLNHLIY